MKKQASNLLKLAVIAGFMTGVAAKADHHEKGHDAAAKPGAEGEKQKCATCKGEKKAKAIAEMKAKGECGASTCKTEGKSPAAPAAPKKK
ncbi:MAG: hypothetical protein AABZ31_01955 [Bdellovibrionota bacterium]